MLPGFKGVKVKTLLGQSTRCQSSCMLEKSGVFSVQGPDLSGFWVWI